MNLKKYLSLLIAVTMVFGIRQARAQTPGFIQQETMKQSGITVDSMIYPLTIAQKQTMKAFYDGLGRTIQTIAVQASPLQNDMIQPAAYNYQGQQPIGYLPYTGKATDAAGSFRASALSGDQTTFYDQTTQYLIAVDTAPHARQVMENSPLQRMNSAGMPGAGYQPGGGTSGTQRYKTIIYRPYNSTADGAIKIFTLTGAIGSNYSTNTLWVTDLKDEDSLETLVFKDLAGHTILKRQVLSTGTYLDTRYIYNAAGYLSYIVPPLAVNLINGGSTLTSTAVARLIYKYLYDTMGRLVSKTAPGLITTSIIYDPFNRPILVQDANMHALSQWRFIKYDVKNRVAYTGTYSNSTPADTGRVNMQALVTATYGSTYYESRTTSTTVAYYTDVVFPTTGITPLAFTYYDNYDWNDSGVYDYAYKSQSLGPNELGATTDSLKGVPTMAFTRTTGAGLGNIWLMKVMFYDRYGRMVQVQSNNQVYYNATNPGAVTDTKTTVPDFNGKPIYARVIQQTGASYTNTILTTLTYDATNSRVASIQQKYNSQTAVTVAAYNYNELGQLVRKNLGQHGSAYVQNVDYRYNIRGQLLTINNSTLDGDGGKTNNDSNDLFGMQILYDQTDTNLGSLEKPRYTGMVNAVKWMTRSGSGEKTNERSYVYRYDNLARYTASYYAERDTGGGMGTPSFSINKHGFDEYNISYDAGGNIQTLNRNNSAINAGSYTKVDSLAYGYNTTGNPNQLLTVTDATGNNTYGFRNVTGFSTPYAYDANGNLVTDNYKGITLKYNLLNRVDSITNTATGGYITYTYDAGGNVLRRQIFSNSITLVSTNDYVDGFMYTTASGTTTLTYAPMPEGRVVNISGTLTPEYVITDQQGNARFSFQDNGSGGAAIIQENSFYAFGENLANSPVANSPTNFKLYNGGSEWQNITNGFPDYLQTPARNYDPAIARFIATDPMPESTESLTSYQYAGNNPVNMNDPSGDLLKPPSWAFNGKPPTFVFAPTSDAFDGDDPTYDEFGDFGDNEGGGMYMDYGSGAGFTSEDEVQETVDYLFNDTPFGGYSTSYNTIHVFGSPSAELRYGYANYAYNGGTMSYEQVVGNYNRIVGNQGNANQRGNNYSYAGAIMHLTGNLLPTPGGQAQAGNSCLFYAMAEAITYYGTKIDGEELLFNQEGVTEANWVMTNGLTNRPITATYLEELTGYYSSDVTSAIEQDYPVLGIYQDPGARLSHDVMITGLGFGGQYTFYNSATASYQSLDPSRFFSTFVVTGITGNNLKSSGTIKP